MPAAPAPTMTMCRALSPDEAIVEYLRAWRWEGYHESCWFTDLPTKYLNSIYLMS